MTTQGSLARRTVLLFALLEFLPSSTFAAAVAGHISFPGRAIPDATLYAHNVDTHAQYSQPVRHGEANFGFDLPAGRYWIFARPEEPGLAGLYGAHTQFSVCRRGQASPAAATCADHGLRAVEISESEPVNNVEIDDWMLPDEAATELDRIVGSASSGEDRAELGRPRFSEYRVVIVEPSASVSINPGSNPRAAELATPLEAAARGGSNFAGGFALTRLNCTPDCDTVAVIDLHTGAVVFPEQLARVSHSLPCRAGRDMTFREDSRLLEYTRRDGDNAVTDYLLWDPVQRSFSTIAQYRRSIERFCASVAPTAP
jgi:hypothetical protein